MSMDFVMNHTDLHQEPTFNVTPIEGSGVQSFRALDQAVNVITVIMLFITMVSLGCTMEISQIRAHLAKPKGVLIALLAQFGIMPLAAFLFAWVFQLEPVEAVTVLICGCCPGGNLSNIFSLALQGDMNLSIVMTTCSTVAGLGLMPLLLYMYCQGFTGLEKAVPYVGIILALIMTIIPCAIGITIHHCVPRYSSIIIKAGLSFLVVSYIAIAVMVGLLVQDTIWLVLRLKLTATAALMPMVGYLLGYILSSLFQLNRKCRRTVAMETGCQNIQLCSTILKVAFRHEVIGPLYLFPLIYIIFQSGEALLFILLFKCYKRFNPSNKEKLVHLAVDGSLQDVPLT